MKPATAPRSRRDTLNLRITPAERNLIDRAAISTGKTRTEFILEAARRAAEDVLLDRALVSVGLEAYVEFTRRLVGIPAQRDRSFRTNVTDRSGAS